MWNIIRSGSPYETTSINPQKNVFWPVVLAGAGFPFRQVVGVLTHPVPSGFYIAVQNHHAMSG